MLRVNTKQIRRRTLPYLVHCSTCEQARLLGADSSAPAHDAICKIRYPPLPETYQTGTTGDAADPNLSSGQFASRSPLHNEIGTSGLSRSATANDNAKRVDRPRPGLCASRDARSRDSDGARWLSETRAMRGSRQPPQVDRCDRVHDDDQSSVVGEVGAGNMLGKLVHGIRHPRPSALQTGFAIVPPIVAAP